MRFIDVILLILMINLTLTLFSTTHIIPNMDKYATYQSTEQFDDNGNAINNTESLSYNIQYYTKNKQYITAGVQNTQMLYLFSGGDFISGLNLFYETWVKGTVLVQPTLERLGIPPQISWYFVIPVMVLYSLALIQFISNRQLLT